MKIILSEGFESQFNIEWHTRRELILPLMGRLTNASSLAELGDIIKCEAGGDYCIFNRIGKIYFTYDRATNEATLVKYAFKIVSMDDF